MMECVCGHDIEEHTPLRSGPGGCEVDDCMCIAFEEYEEIGR
jgi:hypothetical protein